MRSQGYSVRGDGYGNGYNGKQDGYVQQGYSQQPFQPLRGYDQHQAQPYARYGNAEHGYMPYQPADNAQWERHTPGRQHRTRFADEADYNGQRDEDGRREEPQYYEAPRRDERQHDSEHRDGYDSRDKPQPARANKPSDNARRTESDSDGQAPTLPTGKGKHARSIRNDAQTEEWERETDERHEAKDAADRAKR